MGLLACVSGQVDREALVQKVTLAGEQPAYDFTPPDLSAIYAKVKAAGEAQMRAAFAIRDKQDRTNAI